MSCAALLLAAQITSCTPAIQALESCGVAEAAEMSRPQESSISPDPNTRETEARKAISLHNRISDTELQCELTKRAAGRLCGDTPEFLEVKGRVEARMSKIDAGKRLTLNRIRQQLGGAPTGKVLNCLPAFVDGATHWTCRALDRTAPRARVVSSADLPLTVGISRQCTFTVLPDGRLISADHCGQEDIKRGEVYGYYSWTSLTGNFTGALPVNQNNLFSGQPFEDLSVWYSTPSIRGLPFYILVRDNTLAGGCQVQDNLYLACAPGAFAELHLREAHVIGFPIMRYPSRDRAETVVLADGKLLFDPDSNRMLVHAAMSQGGSGGPVYLDSGQKIGGVAVDRPVYLGPMSAFSPPAPPSAAGPAAMSSIAGRSVTVRYSKSNVPAEINYGETLAIVGIYDNARVRTVLPPKPPALDKKVRAGTP